MATPDKQLNEARKIAAKTTLDRLRPGKSARVTATSLSGQTGKLLGEMGVCAGEQIEVCHLAPVLKDPIAIQVGNRKIAIRKRIASLVEVSESA